MSVETDKFESELVVGAQRHLLVLAEKADTKYSYLPRHVAQVERWARRLLGNRPEANKEVTLCGVWLHDSGLVSGPTGIDHAVNSEAEVRRFLPTLRASEAIVTAVAHCVRAHRCRDVQPETVEAKILAVSDSASHMTDTVYIDMANRGEREEALAKLGRDLRDISLFPELGEEITPLYEAWKNLLSAYPKF